MHDIYGSCDIALASSYDLIWYRASRVDRLLYFGDLNSAKAQSEVYEKLQNKELERPGYWGRVMGGDYEEKLRRLTDDTQGCTLEAGEGT